MGLHFDFDETDAFAAGAIGRPGERTFYLQVRAEGTTVCMKCEKFQVAELARYLRAILSDMPDQGRVDPSTASLVGPVEEDFVLRSIGLGVDRASSRVMIQLEDVPSVDEDDDAFDLMDDMDDGDDEDGSVVRALITPAQARAFCEIADSLVASGREPCQWCGAPKDPTGHACPRMN